MRLWLTSCLLAFVTLFTASCGSEPHTPEAAPPAYTLYLVRHAEKQAGPDPALTQDGQMRARILADRLGDADLQAIYSTDYKRTQATAAPIAERLSRPVISYDPRDLETFADTLRDAAQTALIVGHSNTTPELVGYLGGEPGEPIVEASEYDRLYELTITDNGDVLTQQHRFGASAKE